MCKNIMTYIKLYPWCLVNGFLFIVAVCGQPLVRLDMVRKPETPKFWLILIPRFSSEDTGTDRQIFN